MSLRGVAAAIADPKRSVVFRRAQVVSFNPGPPKTCSVLLDGVGDPVNGVSCVGSINPAVGDWVIVAVSPGLWFVIGDITPTSFFEVFDTQVPPVRRVRVGLQTDGRYGVRVWGSNGLLDHDFTT